ncbi:MAG: signal peptide peptidase SppA, partial [Fimbriimonadaceae bacterium]|nr:signal peptide peptidase SppA [Alphaproteobacteria bacterium]
MSFDADAIVDRRLLRRKLTLWRVLTFVAVAAAILFATAHYGGKSALLGKGDHVARVTIDGFISDDRRQQEMLETISKSDEVKAVILSIDSPGGTTTGSEALFESLRAVAAKKPVVAVLGTLAASGGYIAAIGADRIIARGNTITGSIGVIFQWAQVKDLLDQIGIRYNEIKSAPLKAEPSPFNETPPEARVVMEAMIADSYDWFVDLVATRRGLSPARARQLGDGRVYTGRQALEVDLVDALGGEKDAMAWLKENHDIAGDMKILDWKPKSAVSELSLLSGAASLTRRFLGSGPANLLELFLNDGASDAQRLDGLRSVWHPSGE